MALHAMQSFHSQQILSFKFDEKEFEKVCVVGYHRPSTTTPPFLDLGTKNAGLGPVMAKLQETITISKKILENFLKRYPM